MIKKTIFLLLCSSTFLWCYSSEVLPNYTDIYKEVRIHNIKIESRLKNWMARARKHAQNLEDSTHYRLRHWRVQMDSIDITNDLASLKELNSLINSDIHYIDDYTHFHKKDFWADPETTLEEGGDCEDIALVKAASLYRLGWQSGKMQLLVGFLTERGETESHAVLMVEDNKGEEYILRSLSNQVIKPSDFLFIPIYAVDGQGTIIFKRI